MSFWMSPGGAAAISGGTSLLGGLLNKDSGRDQRVWATWMDNRNYDRQRYMAQHSTGWQLDDVIDTARSNGIHALAALGTQSAAQYTPGNIPTDTFGGGNTKKALGDAMSSAVNTFFQAKEMKMREERNDAEINLLEAQAKSYEDDLRNTIVAPGMGGTAAAVSGAGNSASPSTAKPRDPHLAHQEGRRSVRMWGVDVPAYLAQTLEDAGGNIVGGTQTLYEIAKLAWKQRGDYWKTVNRGVAELHRESKAKGDQRGVINLKDLLDWLERENPTNRPKPKTPNRAKLGGWTQN